MKIRVGQEKVGIPVMKKVISIGLAFVVACYIPVTRPLGR
jgi:hypothetical protein